MKCAAIDIGSYTLKLTIGALSDDGRILIIGDYGQEVRLIEGLDPSQNLTPEYMDQCLSVLRSYRKLLKLAEPLHQTRVVATQALRTAKNSDEFSARALEVLGERVQILPTEEESAYVYLASYDLVEPPEGGLCIVVDVGGGSTEVVVGDGKKLVEVFSLPLGASPLARTFLKGTPVTDDFLQLCEHLDKSVDVGPIRELVGERPFVLAGCGSTLGGAASLLGGHPEYHRQLVHQTDVSFEGIYQLFEALAQLTTEEREQVPGLEGYRGLVMMAGLAIWIFLMDKLGATMVTVSDNGLRHGVLREILGLEREFA